MHREGRGEVLVTLVRVAGSSYRRPGARMLIGADGGYCGTISGGCLEAEVVRRAMWKTRSGALVERYSTMVDDPGEIPFGLGCGGVLELLLERAGTAEFDALMTALTESLAGEGSVVATWLPGEGRALGRAVFSGAGELRFRSETLRPEEIGAIDVRGLTGPEGVFAERIAAPQRLFVIGAGDDARPLVNMAAMLGWTVMVVDGRAQMARPERFPEAERVVAGEDVAGLGIGERDAVVVMTHSYEQDRTALRALLSAENGPAYLGLLGARHRSSLLLSDVAAALGRGVDECSRRVHAPVGLDLGGDGAAAIALAVLAEVHACVEGRMGSSRRLTVEEIAENVERGGGARYLQAECAL